MNIFGHRSNAANAALAIAISSLISGCDGDGASLDAGSDEQTVFNTEPTGTDDQTLPTDATGSDSGGSGSDPADVNPPTGDSPDGPGLATGSPDTQYDLIRLAGDSECLNVNETANYQLVGSFLNDQSQLVSEDLSGFANISGAEGTVSVISIGDSGISLQLNEVTVAAIPISVGDQTTTQYLSAIPASTQRPVIVGRQTQDWCAYILYGVDGTCASVANSSTDDGQTLTITATASASATGSNGSMATISLRGCELNNPQDIPVMQIGG